MPPSRLKEIFRVFLKLGLTSFGGPMAHLGYFHDELIKRRRWISENQYASLIALCQSLPGPTSSQVGFALGLLRGGFAGALMAWAMFTLPSALLLIVFAYGATLLNGPLGNNLLHGLKIAAVAIVAQAVAGMARTLCPDVKRAAIAVIAAVTVTLAGNNFGQIAAIMTGSLAGLLFCKGQMATADHVSFPVATKAGHICLALFFILLAALPLAASLTPSLPLKLFDSFYRSGALVFGGGHVVLPLLQAETVHKGLISSDAFLAGYGAAQAVPGPLFTFSAYLGAAIGKVSGNGLLDAALCLIAIFLPGFLLLAGMLPFWNDFRTHPAVHRALQGTNAAVVGLLAAAFYNPVWITTVHAVSDITLAAAGFALLTLRKTPPWVVVVLMALGSIALTGYK